MVVAGALVSALGVGSLVITPRVARSYYGNRRILRAFFQFGGVMLVIVGALWIAGVGTK